MSTEPRKVTVNVLVTKSQEIDEPGWCVDAHAGAQFMPDVAHNGPEVSARMDTPNGTVNILTAWITHAPYAERAPEPAPLVAIDLGGDILNLAPDAVPGFTALARAQLDRIEQLAAECNRICNGGGQ
ncbi:DUF6907 domain-containing protein [Streptomyces cadmiisoli]|uniref:DUF6907 domain-containing protein n=1 Tax=Streptomyces cadmiisoli TaxID=2184053 RepID=UPI003662DC41